MHNVPYPAPPRKPSHRYQGLIRPKLSRSSRQIIQVPLLVGQLPSLLFSLIYPSIDIEMRGPYLLEEVTSRGATNGRFVFACDVGSQCISVDHHRRMCS